METLPITARSFEKDYHIDGDEFGRAYKDLISGFRTWEELDHADEWLIFPENVGPHVSIDETCLSAGEVYTIISNKDAHGRKGCIIAIVKGTKAKDVVKALKKIDKWLRKSVVEVTLDFSESIRSIVKACFPDAMITLDRFHHQQFCLEALQEVRREHRLKMKELARNDVPWVDDEGNAIRGNARYCPERLENDETRAELLARSRGLLIMSPDKWTDTQKERAGIFVP